MIAREISVDIAAAGEGSRLRRTMDDMGYPPDYPKHLLPTGNPDGETLLGRIVRQSLASPLDTSPTIYTNPSNGPIIASHPDVDPRSKLVVAQADTSFGDYMRSLVGRGIRTLGASGDHYTQNFAWGDLLNHHDSHPYPVTIVTGQCTEVDEGAVFDMAKSGEITRFRRVERTTPADAINIGLYVFDPADVVLRSLHRIGVNADSVHRPMHVSPETIVTTLINDGLVGAYMLPKYSSFNVNTPETYDGLLRHTTGMAPLSENVHS